MLQHYLYFYFIDLWNFVYFIHLIINACMQRISFKFIEYCYRQCRKREIVVRTFVQLHSVSLIYLQSMMKFATFLWLIDLDEKVVMLDVN